MGASRAAAILTVLCVACAHKQRVAARPPPEEPVAAPASVTITDAPERTAAAPVEARKRKSPTSIARAGGRPLDPAARGKPFAWPTYGVLISGFGERERDKHDGIDLAAPEGTDVKAACDGKVLFAGEQRGYGNLIVLEHGKDVVTVYAHNAQNLVVPGDRVEKGQTIARVGHTGNATGPHLHFEVRVAARPHDPLGFLR